MAVPVLRGGLKVGALLPLGAMLARELLGVTDGSTCGVSVTMPIFRHLLPSFAPMLLQAAGAGGFEQPEALDRAIAGWLAQEDGGAEAVPVDRRLRLAACPAPVLIEPGQGGALTVRCVARGWRIRVLLIGARGARPVTAARARGETLVESGQQVTAVVQSRGFSVSTAATAMESGGAGDRIRLRTGPRSAPIVGVVQADGRVAISGLN